MGGGWKRGNGAGFVCGENMLLNSWTGRAEVGSGWMARGKLFAHPKGEGGALGHSWRKGEEGFVHIWGTKNL